MLEIIDYCKNCLGVLPTWNEVYGWLAPYVEGAIYCDCEVPVNEPI